MTTWKDTGTWIVRDEYGRLHWRDCNCMAHDGLKTACATSRYDGFKTESDAQTHALRLETAQGYACAVHPLQVR